MPSQEQLQREFKYRYPEEYERQQKLAQEIFKDIPKMPLPNFFGTELSRRNTASLTDGAGR